MGGVTDPVPTGSRADCKSSWGTFDMVGNVSEFVADWTDLANVACTDWTSQSGIAGGDSSCFGGDASTASARIPGALFRGGDMKGGSGAGVFAVDGHEQPSITSGRIGFRCAR
jgi:formylglycine-generating enzyme required for sulfatase activity